MPKKTTKKSKTTNPRFSKQQIAIILLTIVLLLLTIYVLVLSFFTRYMWYAQQSESNTKISTIILQAVDDLSNPAPIEAQTGKVYFHQVKLNLPAAPVTIGAEVEYRYSPAENEIPEEFRIVNTYGFWSARSAMIGAQNMEDTFKQVPMLQACARGYQISFSPITDTQDSLKFTKQLSDGRNVYVYQDAGCKQSNEDFENYLKQINSY